MNSAIPPFAKYGRLLVFEGPDGVGKTTISRQLVKNLAAQGEDIKWMSFPGKEEGTLGKLVYDLHHGQSELQIKTMTPSSLQALHIASHLDSIENLILPAIASGTTVVLDRFWWSTWVYGRVAGISADVLMHLIAAEKATWGRIRPAILFLINRRAPFGFEADSQWASLVTLYQELRMTGDHDHQICDLANLGSIEAVCSEAVNKLRYRDPHAPR